jgi:NDP-sugar pyrophosphorylase family protein
MSVLAHSGGSTGSAAAAGTGVTILEVIAHASLVRDSILRPPVPQNIFICNIDICSSWPLTEMMELHGKHRGVGTILGVNVSASVRGSDDSHDT